MGSYYIPSNKLKGEGRILYIFTTKSLIYTAVGALIGLIFYLIFSAAGVKMVGIIVMAMLAVTGYAIGTIKVPTTGNTKISKNVGGESLDEIITEYITFKKNKKIYTYSIPRKEPNYITINDVNRIKDALQDRNKTTTTKEEE